MPLPPKSPGLNPVDRSTGSGHLAVPARQLAPELAEGRTGLQILRLHPRPLLLRLEGLIDMPWKIMSIGTRE